MEKPRRSMVLLFWIVWSVATVCGATVGYIFASRTVPRTASPLPCVKEPEAECLDMAYVRGPGDGLKCPASARVETTRIGSSDNVLIACLCKRDTTAEAR